MNSKFLLGRDYLNHKANGFLQAVTALVILHPSFADKIDSDFDEIACRTRTRPAALPAAHGAAARPALACDFAEFVASAESSVANERPARKSVPFAALTRARSRADPAGLPS